MSKTTKNKGKSDIGITPLGDRVIVKALDGGAESKSASGIIIPVSAKEEKPDRGEVVAVGEGRTNDKGETIAPKVKVGDKVIFQWGDKLTVDEHDYYVVSESNILAITKK